MIGAIDVFVFCAIAMTVCVVAVVFKRSQSDAKEIPPMPLLRVRRDTLMNNDARERSFIVRFDRSLQRALIRGGVSLDSTTYTLLLGCFAFLIAGVAFVAELHLTLVVLVFGGVITVGMIAIYVIMAVRISKFAKNLPTSLELLERATRAGENLENAFRLAGESSEEPVKGEFLQCVKQMQMGLDAQRVAEDLASRIDSVDVHLLAHNLAIHQRLGGKLADSLSRLSTSIRDRSQCEEKIKSMTSIGRYSVLAIVVMGLFVLGYMLSAQPEYIDNLFTSPLGTKLLVYAAVSELIGLIWVGFTLKSDF
ncbi:type II secretion system F family protein [Stieleria varia]|uniref:Bacterial type II secretion system protein F domain protein n=1 Tax=Stieleria varia TaxID=2528005 RepID=A0A5C6B2M5_9BACT|nr:type II secretion system F family protein [Stieleria varia]TWU06077.1 Bacterial type II secretion system protein F domain protein [Stieleria varia]